MSNKDGSYDCTYHGSYDCTYHVKKHNAFNFAETTEISYASDQYNINFLRQFSNARFHAHSSPGLHSMSSVHFYTARALQYLHVTYYNIILQVYYLRTCIQKII